MAHTTRYAFKGLSRLAADCGVSKSTITRLAAGECRPSFELMLRVTASLERATCRAIDPRELISFDGTYPTPSVCDLVGCRGCLPDAAYDEDEQLRPGFRGIAPGSWSQTAQQQANQ